jgi:hypothetical protein
VDLKLSNIGSSILPLFPLFRNALISKMKQYGRKHGKKKKKSIGVVFIILINTAI